MWTDKWDLYHIRIGPKKKAESVRIYNLCFLIFVRLWLCFGCGGWLAAVALITDLSHLHWNLGLVWKINLQHALCQFVSPLPYNQGSVSERRFNKRSSFLFQNHIQSRFSQLRLKSMSFLGLWNWLNWILLLGWREMWFPQMCTKTCTFQTNQKLLKYIRIIRIHHVDGAKSSPHS